MAAVERQNMLSANSTHKTNRTLLSLFSGIGGLDEGLHAAGFMPLFCSELDANARESLRSWCRHVGIDPMLNDDINTVDPHALRRTLGLKSGELDLLAGGPPCQSFSLIGKRGSLEDHRGVLLYKMVEFAEAFKPKAVLIEQVKGLLSAKGADGRRGSVLDEILGRFELLGYRVSCKVLRAADYGVPQLRDRVFIVATRHKHAFEFPQTTHAAVETGAQAAFSLREHAPYVTVRDAIENLPPPTTKGQPETIPGHLDITPQRDRERITGVPEGECLARQLHLPADQRQRLDPEKDTTKFRRLAWDLPALTLRGGEAFYHPTENRYLTPREYMRLHGFQDSRVLSGPIRGRSGSVRDLDQHRQIANAVPPPLAKAIGEAVVHALHGRKIAAAA